ncbi:MAG TPA: fatty acid oxidation complex subunit alpha FadJ, partial [Cytophagales bacterium]|nr:fatty acid oxidation complex subunit alpha FadJ [Cytophagales bacterium]
ARIASNSPKTFMGLPEVKIGLLPGGAGTQLLPRLVGLQGALDMILTGKNIYAYKAKKMGLVDDVVEPDKLKRAAIIMAERLLKKPMERKGKKGFMNWFLEKTPVGRNVVLKQAGKMAMKQSQGNYPAIPAILDCIETGVKKGLEAGLAKEREHFEALMLTPESKALRSLFFATTDNKKNPYGKSEREIHTLGMIGAGFMGAGIAEVSVTKGVNVLLKDIAPETLQTAQSQIWKSLQKKVKRRALSKPEAQKQMGNLQPQLDYRAFDQADMVIEAVLEKMDLKKVIIKDIEEHSPEDVIIASNTSSLSLTEMAQAAKKPENVIGMHYFSPVPKMPLLEIVTTEQTSKEVISACYDFGLKQGKTVVVVKDGPGFYVNRILGPYLNECLLLVDEGAAFDVVDKALIKKGFPVGPITLLDQVGLDISAHVTEVTRPLFEPREGFKTTPAVTQMYEAGRLGRKNGQGFYTYDPKSKKRKGPDQSAYKFFNGNGDKKIPLEDMQNRAVLAMLNEAVMCLEEGLIANPTDGDLGAVFGIGFLPFTGGPFRYLDSWGPANVVAEMER